MAPTQSLGIDKRPVAWPDLGGGSPEEPPFRPSGGYRIVIWKSLFIAVFLLTAPTLAQYDPAANQLAGEAKELYSEAAMTANPAKRLDLLNQALAKFDLIVSKHPDSLLAEKILAGGNAAGLGKKNILQAIERTKAAQVRAARAAQASKCFATPTAKCLADAALQDANEIENPNDLSLALSLVAEAKAKSGDVAGALWIVRDITNANDRAKTLFHIAGVQAAAGDFGEAQDSAGRIDGPDIYRVLTLGHIGAALAEVGDTLAAQRTIADALAIARSIPETEARARALGALAGSQAGNGKPSAAAIETYSEALDTGRKIDNVLRRTAFYRDIAIEQAKAGLLEAATKTFNRAFATSQGFIGADSIRDAILSDLAEAQANSGDIAAAFETSRRILGKRNTKALLMVAIAGAQAKAGDTAGALATAREIGRSSLRALALSRVATVQAEAGNVVAAKKILADALDFESAGKRANALTAIAIASAQFKTGQVMAAKQTTAKLLADANSTEDPLSKAAYLTFIAQAQAEVGDFTGALETIRSIGKAIFRANALVLVSIKMAEVN